MNKKSRLVAASGALLAIAVGLLLTGCRSEDDKAGAAINATGGPVAVAKGDTTVWIKDIVTIGKDIVTACGIIVGGIWAFTRWGFTEALRTQKEMPGLDGEMKATAILLEDHLALVAFEAIWRNRSPLPIDLNTGDTCFEVYLLLSKPSIGPISDSLEKELTFKKRLLPEVEKFTLEPQTESRLQAQFVVDVRKVYLVRSKVCHLGETDWTWKREMIWSGTTGKTREEKIRPVAYAKWEAAGRPFGDGLRFWLEAEAECCPAQLAGPKSLEESRAGAKATGAAVAGIAQGPAEMQNRTLTEEKKP